jgi:hypothetical protein
MVDEPIEKYPLTLKNFYVCGRQIEPGSAVDLGKGLHLPGFRGPFDLESVALDCICVEITFDGERGHPLTCTLAPLGRINEKAPNSVGALPRIVGVRPSYAAEAFLFTPLRSATPFSFVFAAFSSLRFVVNNRTTSSWPSSSAQAISVP